jgi:hypothetical protein
MLLPSLVSSSSASSYEKDFTDFDLVSARQDSIVRSPSSTRSVVSTLFDSLDAASQLIPLVQDIEGKTSQTPVRHVIDLN